MTDTGSVNDYFHFGEHAKRPARLGGPPPQQHVKHWFDLRLLWIAAGLVVAAVIAFVVLSGADEAGKQIADVKSGTVAQIDTAYDAAAQGMIGLLVVGGAEPRTRAQHGSFTTDIATLSAWTTESPPSSGPSDNLFTVLYAVSGSQFGAAVEIRVRQMCWWVRIDQPA